MLKNKPARRTSEGRTSLPEFQESPGNRFLNRKKLVESGNLQHVAAIGLHLGQDELAALGLEILLQRDKKPYARTAQIRNTTQVDNHGRFVIDRLKRRLGQVCTVGIETPDKTQQRNRTYLFRGDSEVRHAGTMDACAPGVNRPG